MLIIRSNNYHLYDISVQFYKVLCTYIIVNRSSMCTSSILPGKCVSHMMEQTPVTPTCAGR